MELPILTVRFLTIKHLTLDFGQKICILDIVRIFFVALNFSTFIWQQQQSFSVPYLYKFLSKSPVI